MPARGNLASEEFMELSLIVTSCDRLRVSHMLVLLPVIDQQTVVSRLQSHQCSMSYAETL